MKTFVKSLTVLLFLNFLLMHIAPLQAVIKEGDKNYVTINGIVKNKENNKSVEYANVLIDGTKISTVTNENGEFSIKVKNTLQAQAIAISHVGYFTQKMHLNGQDMNNIKIYLMPKNNLLKEVVIRGDAQNIVRDAIEKIKNNYESKNCMITCFYRETARKRQHYINISEAVVNVYKTTYSERYTDNDQVAILKGRKLLSEKSEDTLAVRLLGGPNLSIYLDVVKNPDVMLDESNLIYYQFKMEEPTFIDNRLQCVISFSPRLESIQALYYGKLYIDNESLAFTRAELSLDMRDRNRATQAILKKRPLGLIFKPQKLTFLIDYKELNGIMYLNYVRNEISFKCDWKRKLFSTGYSIVSEMVMTDIQQKQKNTISPRKVFDMADSFTDKVSSFSDTDFWGAYNIIAPTESLEKAVNKLKKQYK